MFWSYIVFNTDQDLGKTSDNVLLSALLREAFFNLETHQNLGVTDNLFISIFFNSKAFVLKSITAKMCKSKVFCLLDEKNQKNPTHNLQ